MEVLRLYDPARRPADWTSIVRPDQFVVFAKRFGSDAPCDDSGLPFATSDAATCTVFDALEEARQYCEARVLEAPAVAFELFDAAGRRNAPLLLVVHPDQQHRLDQDPGRMRRRTIAAIVLVIGAFPLLWFDYTNNRGVLVLPTFLAINMLIAAGRLAQLNMAVRSAEQQRQERLAGHVPRA